MKRGYSYYKIGDNVAGYTYLGEPIAPPLSTFVLIQDRGDGKWWALTHASLNGLDYFAITDDINTRKQASVAYGAYDGPHLPNHPGLRLLIRDGWLGYEETPVFLQSPPITTRKLMQRNFLTVIVPAVWRKFPDELGWFRTG